MPYDPPIRKTYQIVNADGSHFGYLSTYMEQTSLRWSYREGDLGAPPDGGYVEETPGVYNGFQSEEPVGGTTERLRWCFPDPMPDPHPDGAVGYVDWPGQPRRWLVP
jgi:hypothetical protein